MPQDVIQSYFDVGSVVNVPCVVSAIGGTPAKPTLTLVTKYVDFSGNLITLTTVDAKQVIVDK
jgi:hypothetical protein